MADDQRQLAVARSVADRNTQIARLPRFDRHPRVQLAVVQADLSKVIDDQAAVERVAVRVGFHDREAAPYPVSLARLAQCHDFRAVEAAHDLRRRAHRQAVQRVFGKYDQVHARVAASCLGNHADHFLRLRPQRLARMRIGQRQLRQADHHTIGRLVQTTKTTGHAMPPRKDQFIASG